MQKEDSSQPWKLGACIHGLLPLFLRCCCEFFLKDMDLDVFMFGKEVVYLVHDGDLHKAVVAWNHGSCLSFFTPTLNLLFKLYNKVFTLKRGRDFIAWSKIMPVWL